ncbi:helix-turn-helix transcriptional regulator [Actomonas aquatica]|uniref:AraC family transcriptional regulator n=1 Tax=Actomonas aquatica TaxID=2866162 RepID=A0ABZ1CAR7_9BACT|nr:AraC family transcriptional regulator [Opitutus sp. WL0086]WRQ87684.1 AraC family transcriptional regulator [Opitutus sp. WL0086]
MSAPIQENPALSPLVGVAPRDYFHGVRAPDICRADNVLAFLRTERAVLHESGFTTRPHHRYVLIVNYETEGSLNIDGVMFRLHPGEAFLITPYQLHFYLDVASPRIRWLFFTFEAEPAEAFAPIRNVPLRLGEAELAEAARLGRLYLGVETAGGGQRAALLLGLSLLLNRLKHLGARRAPSLPASGPDDGLLVRVNRLLAWHLKERLGIGDLAGRLSMSESHLRRRFRQLTGMSLGGFLLQYRLNRAIKLLVHSELSLTQIAFECGYESLAAFSRSFRAKVGKTPSAFRKAGR